MVVSIALSGSAEILAVLPGLTEFLDNLGYQAAGMLIVLGALGGLWLAVSTLGRVLRFAGGQRAPAPVPSKPTLSATPAPAEELDPCIVAAISAAIHVTLKQRFQIISIQTENSQTPPWSQEGRREIYHSHRVR